MKNEPGNSVQMLTPEGKTIQTLAHVLVEKEAGRLDAPALVVAPTSLMGNWQAEAARFAPSLRVLVLHGKDRATRFDRIDDADLVLTTYPLLGRDEAELRRPDLVMRRHERSVPLSSGFLL